MRKMRRQLDRQEKARLEAESEALKTEQALQSLVIETASKVTYMSGTPSLRDTLEFTSSLHTRNAATEALRTVGRGLDPLEGRVQAASALAAAAASPGPPWGLEDPEAAAEAARQARMQRLMRPPGRAFHGKKWDNSLPDPLWIERVPNGADAADYSLIPQTHPDQLEGTVAWIPSTRSAEVTVVPAGKLLGVTGTWRGHHALDADAGEGTGRGFSSTRAPQGGMTSGSLARFTHDPIPSHILPPSQFTRTSQAIPTQLLKSLTRPQLCKPRHPAYLLDMHLHHADAWRRPKKAGAKPFSEYPRMAPPTLNDLRRAAVAMVPDRCLPSSDPIHEGKAPYNPAVVAPALFSQVPLDYEWEAEQEREEKEEREGVFWKAAALAQEPYRGREGGEGWREDTEKEEEGEEGERGRQGTFTSTTTIPSHLLAPLPSPMRRGDAYGHPTHKTYSSSFRLPSSSLGSSGALASKDGPGFTSSLTLLKSGGGGGSGVNKFQALRSALIFGSKEATLEYEAARANLAVRHAMGAKALEKAKVKVLEELNNTERRLVERGVNTGLGTTGRGGSARLIKQGPELLRKALETW